MRRLTVASRKKTLQVIKEIDAFPKIPESYKETSASGGGISILVFVLIGVLVVSEVRYYSATDLKYSYDVDTDFESKLNINIDITVAMPCSSLGADVLDMTGQNTNSFGKLQETDVYFDLSPGQREFFEVVQSINNYVKNEYHAIHNVLWNTGYGMLSDSMPKREDTPKGKPDGCRFQGTLTVNKVAGNFHITAGKVRLNTGAGGHAHLALGVKEKDYNFSHRINSFSFGELVSGIVNPLDGEEKITKDNYHMHQYFMQVVPTLLHTHTTKLDSYMYAVTERNRSINHGQGSHGVPGIFVKYDMSSLKVSVREVRRPFWKFLVRMCGIVGGIFATSGLLHSITGFVFDCVFCRLQWGKYSGKKEKAHNTHQSTGHASLSHSTQEGAFPPSPSHQVAAPISLTEASSTGGHTEAALYSTGGQPSQAETPLLTATDHTGS